jgi:flagella basal body P-ring formation protein FlgA
MRINVRLAGEAAVENNLLTLGDVAQISGGSAEGVDRLRAVSLGYAPNVGMHRELAREKILLAIAAAGFSSADVSVLASPAIVRIRRRGQAISHERLREAAEKILHEQFDGSRIEARIVRLDLPEKIDVPVGKIDIRANASGIRNLFAPFALSIEIRVSDAVVRRFSANVEIEAFAEVLVAARDLSPDDSKIGERDVRLEKRRLEKPLAAYLRETEKLRGIKLIKNLASGAELTADSFVAGVVVRSGDLVRIVGQSGKLQIAVNGEARTSGKIGDRIAVKNSQSNQIVQATIVEEGTVRVSF